MKLIINPNVHEGTKLSRSEFLDKVGHIKGMRGVSHSFSCLDFTPYPVSIKEFNSCEVISQIVNNGDFSGVDPCGKVDHAFGAAIPDDMFEYFKRCEVPVIQKHIVCWLAAIYAYEPDKRSTIDSQVYQPVLREAKRIFEEEYANRFDLAEYVAELKRRQEYSDIYWKVFRAKGQVAANEWSFSVGTMYPDSLVEKLEEFYIDAVHTDVCERHCGSPPPEILAAPSLSEKFGSHVKGDWGVPEHFNRGLDVPVPIFGFSFVNWDDFLRKNSKRELYYGAEAEDVAIKWKHQFAKYDTTGEHVYSLYDSEPTKGHIYLMRDENTTSVKIGFTSKPDIGARQSSLQTGNPGRIEVLGSFRCSSRKTEKVLHEMFSEHRLRGEWFDLSEHQVDSILDKQWRIENHVY